MLAHALISSSTSGSSHNNSISAATSDALTVRSAGFFEKILASKSTTALGNDELTYKPLVPSPERGESSFAAGPCP